MSGRFIKLYEQITRWEWYQSPSTFCMFIHLLLKANYKDFQFEGRTIRRGQLVTSLSKLATSTGLTFQQARTALERLQTTGEITSETTNRYRIITVVRYDDYQSATSQTASKQQANNKQSNKPTTSGATTSIEYIENIENIEMNRIQPKGCIGSAQRFTPPTREEVVDYCQENGIQIDVDRFIDFYSSKGWMVGKNKMKDYKAAIRNWSRREKTNVAIASNKLPAQDFHQRDYSGEQEAAMERMMNWNKSEESV